MYIYTYMHLIIYIYICREILTYICTYLFAVEMIRDVEECMHRFTNQHGKPVNTKKYTYIYIYIQIHK